MALNDSLARREFDRKQAAGPHPLRWKLTVDILSHDILRTTACFNALFEPYPQSFAFLTSGSILLAAGPASWDVGE